MFIIQNNINFTIQILLQCTTHRDENFENEDWKFEFKKPTRRNKWKAKLSLEKNGNLVHLENH